MKKQIVNLIQNLSTEVAVNTVGKSLPWYMHEEPITKELEASLKKIKAERHSK